MNLYYLKTATEELVFAENQFETDNAPTITARRNGTFRTRGAVTRQEQTGYSIDGGVTRLTKAEYNALNQEQLLTVVPFMRTRRARLVDAMYLAAWDGVSPFVDVIVSAGYDPFSEVSVPVVDPVTHVQTGTAMVAPGIPFAGWPQTAADPPAPAPEADAKRAARQAKRAAQAAWEAASLSQPSESARVAWEAQNPFPA